MLHVLTRTRDEGLAVNIYLCAFVAALGSAVGAVSSSSVMNKVARSYTVCTEVGVCELHRPRLTDSYFRLRRNGVSVSMISCVPARVRVPVPSSCTMQAEVSDTSPLIERRDRYSLGVLTHISPRTIINPVHCLSSVGPSTFVWNSAPCGILQNSIEFSEENEKLFPCVQRILVVCSGCTRPWRQLSICEEPASYSCLQTSPNLCLSRGHAAADMET